jgi:hypothetical protein
LGFGVLTGNGGVGRCQLVGKIEIFAKVEIDLSPRIQAGGLPD